MIRPAADRKNAFLRCRSHALTMARRIGRLPTPWTVSTPHRPSGISVLSNFYDRQSLVYQHSCRPHGRQPPQGESTQKDTGKDAPLRGIVLSRVSVLLGYPVFAAPRWAQGFIPSSRGWEQSTSCLRNLCGKSPIQAAWRGGNFSIEMASVSVNCSFLPGCLGQCDQGKIDSR